MGGLMAAALAMAAANGGLIRHGNKNTSDPVEYERRIEQEKEDEVKKSTYWEENGKPMHVFLHNLITAEFNYKAKGPEFLKESQSIDTRNTPFHGRSTLAVVADGSVVLKITSYMDLFHGWNHESIISHSMDVTINTKPEIKLFVDRRVGFPMPVREKLYEDKFKKF